MELTRSQHCHTSRGFEWQFLSLASFEFRSFVCMVAVVTIRTRRLLV